MASIASSSEQGLTVSGELRFDNVLELKEQGTKLMDAAESEFEIDLSGVTRSGSAAVSLLLSWMRYAVKNDIKLTFSHLPADLVGVAKVSDIDQILPIAP